MTDTTYSPPALAAPPDPTWEPLGDQADGSSWDAQRGAGVNLGTVTGLPATDSVPNPRRPRGQRRGSSHDQHDHPVRGHRPPA